MKKVGIPFFILAATAIAGWYYWNGGLIAKEKTLVDLLNHFITSGATVELPEEMTAKEKAYVKRVNGMFEVLASQAKSNDESPKKIIESDTFLINSIRVKLICYRDEQIAKQEYDADVRREAREKADAEARDYKNRGVSEYYLNKNFVLQVYRFKARLMDDGGLTADDVEIDPNELQKIVSIFNSFQP